MMPGTFSKFFLQVLVMNGMGNAFKPATSRVKLLQKTVDLLGFLAANWRILPRRSVNSILLFKKFTWNGEIKSCNLLEIKRKHLKIYIV